MGKDTEEVWGRKGNNMQSARGALISRRPSQAAGMLSSIFLSKCREITALTHSGLHQSQDPDSKYKIFPWTQSTQQDIGARSYHFMESSSLSFSKSHRTAFVLSKDS